MPKKNKRYTGVHARIGKKGISYSIDYVHPETGERVRKRLKGVKGEAEAGQLRAIEIADAQRRIIDKGYGIKIRGKTVLFSKAVETYLQWSKGNRKSWKTDEYRSGALIGIFGGKLLSEINSFSIEKFKMSRVKEVSKNSVNKELILGAQIFKKAIKWGNHKGSNPFLEASRFKITKPQKPGSLSPEEVEAIVLEMSHKVKGDMVRFIFNTGWRISEVRRLEWDNVNFETGRAWIVDPKNSETREIELNDEAMEIIRRQTRRGDCVFCHLNGKPFKTNLHKAFKAAAGRAEVQLPPGKAWHILRRTWASMMLQNGCDVETLRDLGNWKDFSMPMWYADAGNIQYKRDVLNKIPKINGKKMSKNEKVVSITN